MKISGSGKAGSRRGVHRVLGLQGRLAIGRWLALLLLLLLLLVGGVTEAHAATYTWTGSGFNSDWNNVGVVGGFPRYLNWGFAFGLPGSGDTVVFGTGFGSGSPDLNGSRTVGALEVDVTESLDIIAPTSNRLTIWRGAVKRLSGSSGRQVIGSEVSLPFNTSYPVSTWDIGGSGELALTGRLVGSSPVFKKTGSGTLSLEGALNNTKSGVTQIDNGTLQLAKSSGVNALTGPLNIGNGIGTVQTAKLEQRADYNLPSTTDVTISSDGWWQMTHGSTHYEEIIDSFIGVGVVTLGDLTVGANNGGRGLLRTIGRLGNVHQGRRGHSEPLRLVLQHTHRADPGI